MAKSKRVTQIHSRAGAAALVSALFLVGCGHDKPLIRTKSETEIAVAAIKSEWLKTCSPPVEDETGNQIGALLKDYVDTAEALAICIKRHNDFVGYIKPIVEKERAGKPVNPPGK